ncbi:MAG: ABC transporter permease [Vicinamibacterales bacterium]
MSAFLGLLRKELYHLRRDRRTLAVIIAMPVLQVVIFGYAIRTDVDRVRLAIVDPKPDAATLALRGRFDAAGVFETRAVLQRSADVDRLFQTGEVQQAIVFEPGFGDDLGSGTPAPLLVITDGTEPNIASLAQSYAQFVIRDYERQLAPPGAAAGIVATSRMRFNPTRESSDLFVPGLMAFVLTVISSLMTAISLAREKEMGTLEAMLVSPLQPAAIIAGKVLPYLGIGFIAAVGVIVEGTLVFDVPLRGSVALLLGEALLFILASLALGVLISSRTSSQRVATMAALLGTMLPNVMLSGFVFPVESMPWPLRAISNIIAGRWFVEIARGIMLKGVGLEYLWQETLILAAMAFVLLAASVRSFKPRLG